MPILLVTYHGGGEMPTSPEARQQMAAAFGAWAASVGAALVDPGAPLGSARTVASGRVVDGQAAATISGYSLLRADDLGAAVRMVEEHPFLGRGGTLQVIQAVDVPG
jgi:hypothetical protein